MQSFCLIQEMEHKDKDFIPVEMQNELFLKSKLLELVFLKKKKNQNSTLKTNKQKSKYVIIVRTGPSREALIYFFLYWLY